MPVYPRVKKTERIRSLFQKVATTNHYEVFFSGFGMMQGLRTYIRNRAPRVNNFFISRDLGLLCNSAELPATSFATAQIEGNRMGIVEKFAHSRVFTDTTMSFYVDSDYRTLQFFELWHEYIASGASGDRVAPNRANNNFYQRIQYPNNYKVDTIKIQKFNKDHFRNVQYTFLNCFPVNVTSMPVSYDGNQVLECQVTFAYDRYYFGNIESLNRNEESASFPQIKVPTNPMNSLDKPSKGTTAQVNDEPTYDDESEANEWGPGGQPTASEQIALANKNNSADSEE